MLCKALRGQHCHWAHCSRLIPLFHWDGEVERDGEQNYYNTSNPVTSEEEISDSICVIIQLVHQQKPSEIQGACFKSSLLHLQPSPFSWQHWYIFSKIAFHKPQEIGGGGPLWHCYTAPVLHITPEMLQFASDKHTVQQKPQGRGYHKSAQRAVLDWKNNCCWHSSWYQITASCQQRVFLKQILLKIQRQMNQTQKKKPLRSNEFKENKKPTGHWTACENRNSCII